MLSKIIKEKVSYSSMLIIVAEAKSEYTNKKTAEKVEPREATIVIE